MNPVFKFLSHDEKRYRDSRFETMLVCVLSFLLAAVLVVQIFITIPGEPVFPESFYINTVNFFNDSIPDYILRNSIPPENEILWELNYEYSTSRNIQEDLYLFGLYCGSLSKYCSVRLDSFPDCIILTVRNENKVREGIIRLFRKEIEKKDIKGQIVLIIDDFGYSYGTIEQGFMKLNPAVTFSVIPGHTYSRKIARLAVRNGHPVMIHMPMEPLKYHGGEESYMIMDGMDQYEVEYRINKAISELPMAKGMNNHMGSRITGSVDMINKISRVLKEQNLFFVDSYTVNGTVVRKVMKSHGIRVFERDIFLDHVNTEHEIRRQLMKLSRVAQKKGIAVGIGHNRSLTLKILNEMMPILENDGFEFIPAGDLLK